ncbi:hypothetical protein ANN_10937 [Periplaneta americana]|uniref:C2H2-type domain-containing protein n=1 Tax=Periplaneta americana TaxID=6978 RepID=A0ABQ8T3M6_PERAM|nr:hypothetical protein ANN_10937 [Periplaneta americana]
MSPRVQHQSYPAFAHIGLRKTRKNLNQVPCPDRDSNPGHLVSRPDTLDRYSTGEDLEKHMCSEIDVNKFKCEVCSQAFGQAYQSHKTHAYPYRCYDSAHDNEVRTRFHFLVESTITLANVERDACPSDKHGFKVDKLGFDGGVMEKKDIPLVIKLREASIKLKRQLKVSVLSYYIPIPDGSEFIPDTSSSSDSEAPTRVQIFLEKFLNVSLPPEPVITCWGTWLKAAEYYNDHITEVKDVVSSLEDESASIDSAKEVMEDSGIQRDLAFLKSHFTSLCMLLHHWKQQENHCMNKWMYFMICKKESKVFLGSVGNKVRINWSKFCREM